AAHAASHATGVAGVLDAAPRAGVAGGGIAGGRRDHLALGARSLVSAVAAGRAATGARAAARRAACPAVASLPTGPRARGRAAGRGAAGSIEELREIDVACQRGRGQ